MTPIEYVVLVLSIVSLWLAGDKNIWTWIFGLVCNILWVIIGIQRDVLIVIITSVIFFVLNIRGFIHWHLATLPKGRNS